MNKIEEQILRNQATILLALSDDGNYDLETCKSISKRIGEISILLNPKNPETTKKYVGSTEDAFSESSEVSNGN